jgi:hypothetical protein
MIEPLAARIPIMTTSGNHEYGEGEAFVSYNARYPMPHRASGSVSNLWWSRKIGPVHLIALCSYAGTKNDSLQHAWLEKVSVAAKRSDFRRHSLTARSRRHWAERARVVMYRTRHSCGRTSRESIVQARRGWW